jgi:purine-binding chemotaxis protein CheW
MMSHVNPPDLNGIASKNGDWASVATNGADLGISGYVVVFQIGRQFYGLPVAEVREIVQLPMLLTLPGPPGLCCGLLNWHGRYLPIVSGHGLVDVPETVSLDSQIVLCGQPPFAMGLLVDHVVDVRPVASGERALLEHQADGLVRGLAQSSAGTVVILHAPFLYALGAQFALRAPG